MMICVSDCYAYVQICILVFMYFKRVEWSEYESDKSEQDNSNLVDNTQTKHLGNHHWLMWKST